MDAGSVDAPASDAPSSDGSLIPVDGGGADAGVDAIPTSTAAACTPGVTFRAPFNDTSAVFCGDGTQLGVPNGGVVFGETYVLPSPLTADADNAFSFELSGWGPFDFELWGTNTDCKAEELLWWGPFSVGTQCAQFRPSKPFTRVLLVNRKMYKSSYSFGTPATTSCPGGACPAGTTGTAKVSSTPLSAPVGNYELDGFDRVSGGWEVALGGSGRMTLVWKGDAMKDGTQALGAGVFRMPSTDPYGDAWYCVGDGSTIKEVDDKNGFLQRIELSLHGVTRLGSCDATAGSGTLTAAIVPSTTSGTYFAADITGTLSSWTGTNIPASLSCSGPSCNLRFRGSPQQHYVHVTVSADLSSGMPTAVPVTSATWFVQPSSTEPFSMACSKEGTLLYQVNDNSKLQLAKVTSPLSCPGTPISNDRFDFTIDPR